MRKLPDKYSHRDPDGRLYQLDNLTQSESESPESDLRISGTHQSLALDERADARGLRKWNRCPAKPGAVPRMKRYLDEQEGRPIDTVWTDIPPINSQAKERLGYPTQKPLALA